MRRLSVRARVLLLVLAWAPMPTMFLLLDNGMLPGSGVGSIVATMLLLAIAATVTVAIASAWIQEARGDDLLRSAPLSPPVGEGVTFQFPQETWASSSAIFLPLILVSAAQVLAIGRARLGWSFVGAIALLFGATMGLIMWKGRYYIDVFDDRLRAQEAFWRSKRDQLGASEILIAAVTRVSVDSGWGQWGSSLCVGVYAEEPEGVSGISIPLGVGDRKEGERCLSRVLGLVPAHVVEPSVVHVANALRLLEDVGSRTEDPPTSVATKALGLVGKGKLEAAIQLLDSAVGSEDLLRARTELVGVVRATKL